MAVVNPGCDCCLEKREAVILETGREADVELAAGEVVGDGVLDVVDVGDPVVAAHV